MAKKKVDKSAKKSKKTEQVAENALPQNILQIGERVEENKNIYISQPAYRKIHKFTKNKLTNESGGVLVGTVIEEFNKTNIIVNGFVEAKYCDASPTTLTFTHETWEHIHAEIEKRFPGQKIVGWIHTHPNFGIFLSEYDKFIHENFFSEDYQIAYVVDPIQHEEGFYFWINGNLEKCKGFFKFDKMGVQIKDTQEKDDPIVESGSLFSFRNLIIAILVIAVAVLSYITIVQGDRIDKLEARQNAVIFTLENDRYNPWFSYCFPFVEANPEIMNPVVPVQQEEAPVEVVEEAPAEEAPAEETPTEENSGGN